MNIQLYIISWLCALLALVAPWQSARAATKVVGSFEEVVADAAVEVRRLTAQQAVFVGQITPAGQAAAESNSGPAIGELLKQALRKLDPDAVKRDALFEVKGDYELTRHPVTAGLQVIALTFRVLTRGSGERKTFELERFVEDNTSIGRILQPTGAVPLDPEKTDREQRRERNQKIAELAARPQTFVDPGAPTLIKTSKESPYAVEVRAEPLAEHLTHLKEPGKHHALALKARIDSETGQAFVDIPRDFVYEVRVINTSGQEAAVAITIDGLDIFDFSEDVDKTTGKPLYSHLVFGNETTVVGWHKSVANKRFDRFLVTEYGKGAASKEGIPATGPVGVIHVAFSRSLRLPSNGRPRSASNETGFGPPEKVEQKPVEREITKPVDLVAVRYTR